MTAKRTFNFKNGVKRIALAAPASIQARSMSKLVRSPVDPKHWFLVIAHSDKGLLDEHAHQTIAAAAMLADSDTAVIVLVMGDLFEDLSNVGADEVVVRPDLDFVHFQPDAELTCIKAAIVQYQPQHIFLPDNQIGDGDLGRRLIAKTGKTAATKVIEINAKHVVCFQQNGKVMAQTALPEIILLAPNAVDARLPFIGNATRANLAFKPSKKSVYEDLGLNNTDKMQIALEEADCVVSAGNGVSNVETIQTLANLLGASVGASRVAVDEGKFLREQQVGATGKTVTASTYFAIGISGAVQHLQGIKDCRHVIAINTDASAPIVKRADLSIIGDAEEVMQALIGAIRENKV